MAEAHNPLEQFEITPWIPIRIGDLDVSFTNSSAFMIFAILAASAMMVLSVRKRALVPDRWQLLAELSYGFIAKMLSDTVGKEGKPYIPFGFTLFMFVLFGNILGMIPYSYT